MAGAEAPQGLGVRSYGEAWHVPKVPRALGHLAAFALDPGTPAGMSGSQGSMLA